MRVWLSALLVSALVASGCAPAVSSGPVAPRPAAATSPGAASEALPLVDLSAEALRARIAAAGEGGGTLVNIWALWCEPCKEELPDLLRVSRELAPDGLRLVLVSADFEDSAADAQAFLTSLGVRFQTWRKPSGGDMAWIDSLHPGWSGSLPASFLFDEDGRLLQFWERSVTYDELVVAARAALRR